MTDLLEFRCIPNQVVVTLRLPKRSARQRQYLIGSPGRDALQRFRQFRQCDGRSRQQMYMIRHDREGMQDIVPERIGIVPDRFQYHVRNRGLTQIKRSAASFVQQSIHSGKCASRVDRAEWPLGRQTVAQTPRKENGTTDFIDVGKPPPVERHGKVVPRGIRNSHGTWTRGVQRRRGRLPHSAGHKDCIMGGASCGGLRAFVRA